MDIRNYNIYGADTWQSLLLDNQSLDGLPDQPMSKDAIIGPYSYDDASRFISEQRTKAFMTQAGNRHRQAAVAVYLASQTDQLVTAYGTAEALKEIGDILPALIAHAGESILFVQPNSFDHINGHENLDVSAKVNDYFKSMIEFSFASRRQEPSTLYKHIQSADLPFGRASQLSANPFDQRSGIVIWDSQRYAVPTHEIAFQYSMIPAHAIENTMMTRQDFFRQMLIHEASHIRNAHGDEDDEYNDSFERNIILNRLVQQDQMLAYGMTSKDWLDVFTLEKEITADRATCNFVSQNPHFFESQDTDKKIGLYRATSFLVDLSHATAVALDTPNPPPPKSDEAVLEAIKVYKANRKVRKHILKHMNQLFPAYRHQTIIKVQDGFEDFVEATISLTKNAPYHPKSLEHKVVEQYLYAIEKIAPTVFKKASQAVNNRPSKSPGHAPS